MKWLMILMQHARLALRDLAYCVELLMLPGGYVLAFAAWLSRHWPRTAEHK